MFEMKVIKTYWYYLYYIMIYESVLGNLLKHR